MAWPPRRPVSASSIQAGFTIPGGAGCLQPTSGPTCRMRDVMTSQSEQRSLAAVPIQRRQRVLALALPAVGEQVLNTLVGLADTFLVGHLNPSVSARLGYSS